MSKTHRCLHVVRSLGATVGCGLLIGSAWLAAGAITAKEPQASGLGSRRREIAPPALHAAPRAAKPLPAADSASSTGSNDWALLSPATQRLLREFLLNGLLVPLLDDSGSPSGPLLRWGDPALLADCPLPSQAAIDGGPVPVGRPLPGRAFTLHWQLHECRPFGAGGPLLSGGVEMAVYPENSGLSANVRLRRMTVEDGAAVAVIDDWHGTVGVRWTL